MNRYAANRVVVGPKVFLPGVVEVCNESVTAYYQLNEELAKTKWLVGTIHVSKENENLRAYWNNLLLV